MAIRVRVRPDLAGIPGPPYINLPVYDDTRSTTQTLHIQDLIAIDVAGPNRRFPGFDAMVKVDLALVPLTRRSSRQHQHHGQQQQRHNGVRRIVPCSCKFLPCEEANCRS